MKVAVSENGITVSSMTPIAVMSPPIGSLTSVSPTGASSAVSSARCCECRIMFGSVGSVHKSRPLLVAMTPPAHGAGSLLRMPPLV